jgi:hypothetical protein
MHRIGRLTDCMWARSVSSIEIETTDFCHFVTLDESTPRCRNRKPTKARGPAVVLSTAVVLSNGGSLLANGSGLNCTRSPLIISHFQLIRIEGIHRPGMPTITWTKCQVACQPRRQPRRHRPYCSCMAILPGRSIGGVSLANFITNFDAWHPTI